MQVSQGSRLSPQQERLWLSQGRGGSFRSQCLVRIGGELDVEKLRSAVSAVARRHEILRTRFRRRPGMRVPLQVQETTNAFAWERIDLAGLEAGEQERRLEQLFEQDRRRPPDFDGEPLWRLALATLSAHSHVLFFSLPALCADMESLGTLVGEIASFYLGSGTVGQLPEEPLQYADFAQWHNELLQEEDEETVQGKSYWQKLELDSLANLSLPGERSPSSENEFEAATMAWAIESELAERLEQRAREAEVELADLVFAAWQVMVWRLTGDVGQVVGRGFSGRGYEDFEGAVGLYRKYLPIAAALAGKLRFSELLKHNAQRLEEADEWGEYCVWAGGGSPEAPRPLPVVFDALAPEPARAAGGTSFQLLRQSSIQERFKLRLAVTPMAPGLAVHLDYDAGLFAEEAVRRLGERLLELLRQAASDPESKIGDLELLVASERTRLLFDFNDTGQPGEVPESTFLDRFRSAAERFPEQPAVVAGGESLSYADLDAMSNRLARLLRRRGVAPEARVAFCADRSPGLILGMLGILKAGGAYVPLDPGLPKGRLQSMLKQVAPAVVLTEEAFLANLPDTEAEVLCLDRNRAEIERESADDPAVEISGENLFYVLFTSGSTGRPKGVAVEHRNLWHYLEGITRVLGVGEGASFAMVSTFAADLGNTAIFPALASGGCLHLLSYRHATDPAALAEYFSRHEVDVLKIVPSHMEALLQAARPEEVLPRRVLVLGGEASTWPLIETLRAAREELVILNHYGPTETTVGSLAQRVDGTTGPASVPVGRPLGHGRAFLADARLRSVPAEVSGEILLGGGGVTRGYLGRPAATAERFIPDLFSARPGRRLYRTGDLGRFLPEGVVEFTGRTDHQVKVRGFRIELGEIESVLRQIPAVREAVAVVREDKPGDRRLAAYLVVQGAKPRTAELRSVLREKLPEHMVPAAFVTLERLPLTRNGKIDRQALPAPDQVHREMEEAYLAPHNQTEESLVEIWQEVLQAERVGVKDNFFELGGDSILAIQVVARAHRRQLRLEPRQFFQHQTISELAAVAAIGGGVEAEQGRVTGEVAMTPIQRWFFEQSFDNAHHWNQAMLLEMREPLHAADLGKVLLHLMGHHDALRLRFEEAESGWRQFYDDLPPEAPLEVVELAGMEDEEKRLRIEAVAADTQSSLDWGRGHLVRVVYFDLGDGEPGRLLLVCHHLLVDGVSWRVLLEDLATGLGQLGRGSDVDLPPKTTSFKSWAARLAEHACGGLAPEDVEWWRAGPPRAPARLPVDFADGDNTMASREEVMVDLDVESTRALLETAPGAYRAQVNDLLVTALAEACARWTGEETLWVELEGHGREDLFEGIDLTRTVGWFTTHYPVFLDLGDRRDPGTNLKAVKEQLRRVPGRGLGHGILRYLSEDRELADRLASHPRPEVGFNYLGQVGGSLAEGPFGRAAESAGPTTCPGVRRRSLVDVVAIVNGNRLETTWRFSRHRHRRETIEHLAQHFSESLRELIAHCSSADAGGLTPSDFSLAALSQDKLEKIVKKVGQAGSRRRE